MDWNSLSGRAFFYANLLCGVYCIPLSRIADLSPKPSSLSHYDEKVLALEEYKFAISFESRPLPGYVSEKVVDVLLGGCVPIYFGAPDVGMSSYISVKQWPHCGTMEP